MHGSPIKALRHSFGNQGAVHSIASLCCIASSAVALLKSDSQRTHLVVSIQNRFDKDHTSSPVSLVLSKSDTQRTLLVVSTQNRTDKDHTSSPFSLALSAQAAAAAAAAAADADFPTRSRSWNAFIRSALSYIQGSGLRFRF